MKTLSTLLAVFASATITSCALGDGSMGLMPESSGRSGEVLLVMDEGVWKGPTGDTVESWLRQEVLVLPQYEPTFKVIHIRPNAFNDMFRKARNVIVTDINPECKHSEFKVESNKFARPQIYITLRAASDSALKAAWYNVERYVLDTLTIAEQSRFLYGLRKYRNAQAEANMRDRHGVDMMVPTSGFQVYVDSTHFTWISKETKVSSQGLLVFDFPYNGPQDFDMQSMIRRIDSVLMLNVPGDAPSSYMAIEKRIEPVKRERSRNGSYLCELRGLWEAEGDFMGGPFVSQSMVDTINNKMVTAFAYVYGGKNEKKNLLWQLESVLSTFNVHYNQIEIPLKKD